MRIRQLFHIRVVFAGCGSARCRLPGLRGAARRPTARDGGRRRGAAADGAGQRPMVRGSGLRCGAAAAAEAGGTTGAGAPGEGPGNGRRPGRVAAGRGLTRKEPHPCDVEPVNPVSQSFALRDIPVSCGPLAHRTIRKTTAGRKVGPSRGTGGRMRAGA